MSYTWAQKAKAVVAFVGSVVTYLLTTTLVDVEVKGVSVGYVLGIVSAVLTAVGTFFTPNAPTEDGSEPVEGVAGSH